MVIVGMIEKERDIYVPILRISNIKGYLKSDWGYFLEFITSLV